MSEETHEQPERPVNIWDRFPVRRSICVYDGRVIPQDEKPPLNLNGEEVSKWYGERQHINYHFSGHLVELFEQVFKTLEAATPYVDQLMAGLYHQEPTAVALFKADHEQTGSFLAVTDALYEAYEADPTSDPYQSELAETAWEHYHDCGRALLEQFKAWLIPLLPAETPQNLSKISPGSDTPQSPSSTSPTSAIAANIIAYTPNFPADRALHRGLMLHSMPGAWGTNEHEGFKFYDEGNGSIRYQPQEIFTENWYKEREAALSSLDRRFRNMQNDLTADVIDILFHHWRERERDYRLKSDKAVITLRQECAYRGITEHPKNLAALWHATRDARCFRLVGDGIDAALFEMDAAKSTQLNLWGLEALPAPDVLFIYSPGFFLAQAIQDNPIYVAPYLQALWKLDIERNRIAKRLGRYLRGEWRLNTGAYLRPVGVGPTRWRTWGSILDDAGIDCQSPTAKRDPAKFIESIEKGINTLWEIEAIATGGKYIYHPDDIATYEMLPRKGILGAFRNLRVCIDPAADTSEALAETNTKRLARVRAQRAFMEAKAQKTTKKSRSSRN